jgi:SAM-dependent methyltransferase
MKFKRDFFLNYVQEAPVPLAIERVFECGILSKEEFRRPILDLGCGEGLFAYILFEEKLDVGIEPNRKELERAKSYGMYKELIECFGDSIPKETGSFNTVFSNSVLEHIPDIDPVLREVNRVLASHGDFYVTVPTDKFDNYSVLFTLLRAARLNSLAERYRLFFNRFWRHYHYYNEEGWSRLFQRNGFEVVKVQGYCDRSACLLNDFLAPFSACGFISKKLFNRWFLFGSIRKLYSPLLDAMFRGVPVRGSNTKNSGLVFFHLKKKSA